MIFDKELNPIVVIKHALKVKILSKWASRL